jgi:exodeoxyribonuclease VII large subunit
LNIERIEGILLKKKEALSQKYQDLISAYKTFIKNSLIKLKHYQQSIDLLNPKNILKKGFSITKRDDGKVIKSIEEVNIDEELITLLVDGEIKSKVKNKQKG